MATVYLIEGPVGAGKSTFSNEISQKINAPQMNLDAWMAKLFSPDRPSTGIIEWYVERKERCIDQIWDVALSMLNTGHNVVLELGLIQFTSRQAMYQRIRNSGHEFVVYVLDVPKDERRERVRKRNQVQGSTFSMVVPDDIFEMANNMWEEPNEVECEENEIIFVVHSAT